MNVTKIVLDISKPINSCDILTLAERLIELRGIRVVNIKVNKIEALLQHLTLAIEGENVDYGKLIETVESSGATVDHIVEIQVIKNNLS